MAPQYNFLQPDTKTTVLMVQSDAGTGATILMVQSDTVLMVQQEWGRGGGRRAGVGAGGGRRAGVGAKELN